jgi:hypothetical protein
MSKRLSSRAFDAFPKSKGIKGNDLKNWKNIYTDDFTNRLIDLKSDFVKIQELKYPDFFENKK